MTTRTTSRIAALGAVVALGTAGLVAVSPGASAAAVKADYTCATTLGDYVVTVTPKTSLPKKVKKGKQVGAKKVVMSVVLPENLADGLRYLGIESIAGTATGAKITVGSTKVKLNKVSFPQTKVPASGPMKIVAKGTSAAFVLKKKGTFKISAPKKFLFTSTNQDGGTLTDQAPCSASGKPVTIGSVKVS